ncbi:prealbumin-like fold domain-containing protein [[Clostridium] polysaccharolyticum]|uniref:Collagen binding domain-containing protein n=1 Tax=[Clostridium] polysaccharolyticum TaxID=29364 RepID=A0A1I0FPH7_9FIRM|nr:prealbumin-like fold domain-containing protein [[Clostridium] polysaccharolyticum]SET60005.1 Collagen binding domain-containing protein [[Clostridium] polysaccharolyticum]
MKKRVLAMLICVVLIMQTFSSSIASAEDETDLSTATIINLKDKGLDKLDQFLDINMKLSTLGGGKSSILYDMNLKNEYLSHYSEQIQDKIESGELKCAGFPSKEGLDDAEYAEKVHKFLDTYYQSLDDELLPPLGFTVTYDHEYFNIPEGQEHVELKIDNTGEKAGVCDLEKKENGDIVLKCKLEKLLYNRKDVELKFTLNYLLEVVLSSNETIIPVWNEEKKIVTGKIVKIDSSLIEKEPEYKITKTAPKQVDTPYIDYDLDASVSDGYLNGKSITDEIPDGLYVESVKLNESLLDPALYTTKSGKFQYDFPKLLPNMSNAITSAKFKIRMALNESKYESFMKKNGIDETFTNKAYIFDPLENKQLKTAESEPTRMKLAFLQKEGEQEDLYGTRFKWNIKVNSYFSKKVNSYIVDTISASTHTYDADTGVDILVNKDGVESTTNVKPKLVTSDIPYSELTNEDLDQLTSSEGNSLEKRSVYYTYMEGTEKRSVLIVPYDKYVNSSVLLTYYTNIVLPEGVNKENYKEVSNDKYTNDVKMVWDVIKMDGGGISFNFDVEVKKEMQAKAILVEKSFKAYYIKDKMITWNLDVNRLGGEFTDLVLMDTVGNNGQMFTEDILNGSGSLSAEYKSGTEQKTIEIPSKAKKVDGKPYYDVIENTENSKLKTLKIVIGDVAANESYEIPVKTIITDNTFYSNAEKRTFQNTVRSEAKSKGKPCGNEFIANQVLGNNLIEKSGMSQTFIDLNGKLGKTTYNYKDHTSKWLTTINTDKGYLENLSAEEELPVGSSFDRISEMRFYNENGTVLYKLVSSDGIHFKVNDEDVIAVEKNGVTTLVLPDGQEVSWKETCGTKKLKLKDKEISVENNKLTISFKNPVEYKIDYNMFVKYSELYRREVLANNETSSVAAVNLHGLCNGGEIEKIRKVNDITIRPKVLTKEGRFNKDKGTISWTIYVNADGINLNGYSISDLLLNQFDLEEDTLKIYKTEVNGLGEMSRVLDVTEKFKSNIAMEGTGKFTVTISEEYKDVPFCIDFDTAIAADISADDAKNEASLNNGKVQYVKSGMVKPSDMEDFIFKDFINASPLYSFFVTKASFNANQNGEHKIALSNADFIITAMTFKDGTWKTDIDSYRKRRSSREDRDAIFVNLEKNTLYELQEQKAPIGYIKENEVHYFVFLEKEEDALDNYPLGTIKIVKNKFYKDMMLNKPNSELVFYKTDSEGIKLKGAKFQLTRKDGKVAKKQEVSDKNGMVVFKELDPGAYILSETEAPEGYQKTAENVAVTVTVDQEGVYSYVVELNENVTKDESGQIFIKNKLLPEATESAVPSGVPEATESAVPSGVPETEASAVPSGVPEATESAVPSGVPETEASAVPSGVQETAESAVPSGVQETAESAVPSRTPKPTASVAPSRTPKPAGSSESSKSSGTTVNTSSGRKTENENSANGDKEKDYNNSTSVGNNSNGQKGSHNSYNSYENNENSSSSGDSSNGYNNSANQQGNESNVPKTGDSRYPHVFYGGISLISLAGIIYSLKKIFFSRKNAKLFLK